MWTSISSESDLSDLVDGSADSNSDYVIILKHSPRCAISTMAKNRLERSADSRISYFLLDVVAHREVSAALAKLSDVIHESPQSFLYFSGQLLDVKSHMGIDANEISRRLDSLVRIKS